MTVRREHRRGETRWIIDIRYRKIDGKHGRFRKDAQVQTRAAATAEERRLLACMEKHGEPIAPGPKVDAAPPSAGVTFGEAVKVFLAGKAVTSLKPTTRIGYTEILETRLLPRFTGRPLAGLGYQDVATLDAELVTEGLSPSRRRNVQVALRSVLRGAADAGQIGAMPRLPALPVAGRTILATLSMEDVERILAAATPAARLALALAAYAGLRAGEIRGLQWGDIDLGAKVLVVRRATSKGQTAAPKSGHARALPLAAPLVALLTASGPGKAGDLVATAKGRQWGEFGLLQSIRRAIVKAGVAGHWRVHDLRHAFVTELFRRGGSGPAVQALAGHSSLLVTQRYAHPDRADLRATIGLLAPRGNQGETGSQG